MRLLMFLAALLLLPASVFAQGAPTFDSLAVGRGTQNSISINPGSASGNPASLVPSGNGGITIGDSGVSGVYVTAKGAVCDGSNDDTAAIQSAIATASARQTDVTFPEGKTCKISSTLSVTAGGVRLRCLGNNLIITGGQCKLQWAGGSSPMVSFTTSAVGGVYSNGVISMTLDGNSTATDGIYINGAQQGILDNVRVQNTTVWAVHSDTNPAVPLNTQGWYALNLQVNVSIGGGVNLACNDGSGIVYCSAFWTFVNPEIAVAGGTGILFLGGSNNIVIGGRIFGVSGTSLDFSMWQGTTGKQSAVANIVWGTYAQGLVISRGTTSIPTCSPYAGHGVTVNTTCPFNNFWRADTPSGGGTLPTVEPGSQLTYQSNILNRTTQASYLGDGVYPGLFISNVLAGYGQCVDDLLANGANVGLWVCTTQSNPVAAWDFGPNQDRFQWYGSGSAGARDLHLAHPLGTGNVVLDTGLKLGGPFTKGPVNVGNLPTCNGGTEGQEYVVNDQAPGAVYDGTPAGGGTQYFSVMCDSGGWHLR